ncbi:MAG: hypothetical protein ABFR32_04095 [Bacteroidota bacterium]
MKSKQILGKEKMTKKLYKLNNQSSEWLADLEFMQDEQKFLEHLLSSHFLDLSTEKYYDAAKKLISKLKDVETMGNSIYETLQIHNKHLATLIESLQLKGKKEFKKEHKQIEKDFETYVLKFKYVKKKIFGIIKDIMKIQKQKLLIKEL